MAGFIRELKRRKVLRVGAAYVVTSWVLLQVADLLSGILDLPLWTGKLVFVILVVGFIPSLILAWAYDLTASGIEATAGIGVVRAEKRRAPIVLAVAFALIGLGVGGWWYSGKDLRWARNEAIPAIETFLEKGETESAFALALQVEAKVPKDSVMAEIWERFSWTMSIPSNPPGATVYRRAYGDPDAEWLELGSTPLYDVHVPIGPSLLRLEAPGYLPLLRVIGGGMGLSFDLPVQEIPVAGFISVNPERFQLETESTLPAGMVRVPEGIASIGGESVAFHSFLLGRYEVSNKEFQEFVDAGGYRRRDLWEHEFIADGTVLSFEESMARFVDSTGRPGPSTWVAGSYPSGAENHPVSGVSWYEAAAYARFVGLSLPTIHHWRRAFAVALLAYTLPVSNVDSDGVAAVGEYQGIGWTGTYDMAGNVREWSYNATEDGGKVMLGGAWDDAAYFVEESLSTPFRLPAFDRTATNGIRLARVNDEANVVEVMRRPIADEVPVPFLKPVSDEVFAAKRSDFDYDQGPLNAEIEETIEFHYWTRQRISIDTPGGDGRMPIYLYLPKRATSRFQTLMYWPGASTYVVDSVDLLRFPLDFALRNGRAVAMPVMKGMFERKLPSWPDWSTHAGRNLAIEQVREFRRAIDYLETRPDIESDKLGFAGFSWGGRVGAIVLAIEDRFKVAVLNQAGINAGDHPDINVVNFLPRVRVPVLQFNGRYDTDFRYETSSKPFFERLGTEFENKRHVVDRTGHYVSPEVVTGETLDWLDKYLGPVD